jgi:hypothetical protein
MSANHVTAFCPQCSAIIGKIYLEDIPYAKERLIIRHRDSGNCPVWNQLVTDVDKKNHS